MLAEAEQPIVMDLARAGFQVESVWDLVNTAEPYPDALPMLLEHLERGGYPDQVLESLARALAVSDAAEYWDRLRELYRRAPSDSNEEEEGLAVALTAAVTPERMDALIDLTLDHTRSDNRLLFLTAINDTADNADTTCSSHEPTTPRTPEETPPPIEVTPDAATQDQVRRPPLDGGQ